MAIVADVLRSTAGWYEPLLDPKDMAEHDVDASWAERNYQRREFFIGLDGEGNVVGTVSLQDAGRHAYVGYCYLFADYVGHGHGRRLLRFVEAIAKDRGYDGLALIAHPDAKWAIRAYEKLGYRAVATDRDDVLAWNSGWLRPYYEEGFHLYQYDFEGARA